MKVLFIYGDDDYSALNFEQSGMSKEEVYKIAMDNGSRFDFETEEGNFTVKVFEFGEVDVQFIQFIRSHIEDYDQSKHQTFHVVEE